MKNLPLLVYNSTSNHLRRAYTPVRSALQLFLLAALLIAASAAFAHHSRTMFDTNKQITLVGTVKDFQWTNPHCWIQVLVPDPNDPNAPPVEWGVEMGAPVELMRKGWKPGSLHPGDKVTVIANPLRDGQHGGLVLSVTGPDGRVLGHPAETQK